MNKKRLLSLVLAVLTVFSTLVITPLTTVAEDPDAAKVAEGYCFKIGTNYYKTLADAAATVAKDSTVTITQIADYSWAGPKVQFDKADTDVTLDLNGHTLARTDLATGGGDGALIWFFGKTLTVKNGTMSGSSLIDYRNGSATQPVRTLNVENMDMSVYYMTAILIRGGNDLVVTNVKNSTISTYATGDGPAICAQVDVRSAEFNFIASTLQQFASPNNGWGGNLFCAAGTNNKTVTLNFDKDSVIRLARRDATANTTARYGFSLQSPAVVNVNLALGSTVEFSSTGIGNVSTQLAATSVNVTDNGAVWKVSGRALNHGVSLPSFAGNNQATIWTVNGISFGSRRYHMDTTVPDDDTLYTATYENVSTSAFEDETLRQVYYSGNYFKMGDTYYKDLAAVKAAMVAGGTYTVTLLADNMAMGSRVDFALAGADITLDLNGHTLNGVNGWTVGVGGKKFTVKNGYVYAGSGFDLIDSRDAACTFVMDDVTMYIYNMTGIAVRTKASSAVSITLKDSTLVLDPVDNGPSLVQYSGNDVTWNALNSTLINANGKGGNIGALFSVWDSGKVTWNVDGTSKLYMSVPNRATAGLFYSSNTVNAVKINLAEGAEVVFDGTGVNNSFVDGKAFDITDNGAVWKFDADAMKNGVVLPNLATDANHTTQWTIGSEKFMGGTTAKSTKLTGLTTGTHAEILTAIKTDAEAVSFGKVCRIGAEGVIENYYSSLADAFASIKPGEEKTITLLKDVTTAEIPYSLAGSKITVDGQNHTVTGPSNGYFLVFRANSDLAIKNLTVNSGKGIIFSPGSGKTNTYTLTNVNLTVTYGIAIKFEVGNSTLTATGCALTSAQSSNDGPLTFINGSADTNVTLNLIDTDMKMGANATTAAPNNSAIYALANHGTVTVNLDEDSTIENNRKNNTKSSEVYLIYDANGTKLTLNLAAGSKMLMNFTATSITKAQFIRTAANTVVNDNGAVWQVGGDALKNGVSMPTIPVAGTVVGYSVNGKLAPVSTGLYKDSSANAGTVYTVTPIAFTDADFNTRTGASIRLADPTGLRFEVEVSDSFKTSLGANAEFGALIAPTASVEKVSDFTSAALGTGKFVTVNADVWAEEGAAYYAALTGIPTEKTAVTMKFSARGFVTVTYADATTATFYTGYNPTANARSIFEVATAAYADGVTGNTAVNAILAVGGAE